MLNGKGLWIWKVANCESGDPEKIVQTASAAGCRWISVKIADGACEANRDPETSVSRLAPLVEGLHECGIQVWGWQYVYGADWKGEAAIAQAQLEAYGLDGYIADAEAEYKLPGKEATARRFMEQLRAELPRLPMALCSYRFPRLHPEFPWDAFLDRVDYNMPQVYWESAHDAGVELERSVAEFSARAIRRPIIPVGPTYRRGRWAPTAADILEFQRTAERLGLAGLSYFSWDECRRDLPEVWQVITGELKRVFLPIVEKGG